VTPLTSCAAPLNSLPHIRNPKRVAIVAFRFGSGFVGGAEASLRNLGRALLGQGCLVEVFTTCTVRESGWKNDLPAGDTTDDGFVIHRYLIDPHDRPRHDEAFRLVIESDGRVVPEIEAEFVAHSIHSSALIAALHQSQHRFDALITGPYLQGLTYRVAQCFPDKTLLLPCFHDEPSSRLRSWLDVYGSIAGLLYHTPEEQDYAQTALGLNHPGATLIGASIPPAPSIEKVSSATRTLIYCGRYSIQKNVPLLLDHMRRYQTAHPGRFQWTFVGEGSEHPPAEPWVRDLGRVADEEKHRVLAQADALVQLSTQESLSLVVLEAWQHATPVVVHKGAAVLVGQIARSGGGVAIDDYESFASTLDDLWHNPDAWRNRGRAGQRYVRETYLDADAFARRLIAALDEMPSPLADKMRVRGLARTKNWARPAWREQFGQFVEQALDAPTRAPKRELFLEMLSSHLRASIRQGSLLVPVRLHNRGNLPVAATNPGAARVNASLRDHATGDAFPVRSIPLADLILPGRSGTILLPIDLPGRIGRWTLTLQIADQSNIAEAPLEIADGPGDSVHAGGIAPLLEAAHLALAEAHARQTLPRDYFDVCEGRFARVKRWIKHKVLNNFKRAYVDVLSSQQSDVNRRLVESVQQLTECCQALDQTVRLLQDRVTELKRSAETCKSAEATEMSEGAVVHDFADASGSQ
jgi:glycosyltransferase involved in cell wall biosynthesis